MPAWQRSAGYFYTNADTAIADAVRTAADLVILSGGYGVVQADEPIGWYQRRLRLTDWPPGLLGAELATLAARRQLRTVIGFAAATSPYADVIRTAPWADAGVDNVVLVTADAPTGGAQVVVPRDLGRAFAAYWYGDLQRLPATLRTTAVLTRISASEPRPATAGTRAMERRADGSARHPAPQIVPPGAEVSAALTYLRDRHNAVLASRLDRANTRLRSPGLYAWWADETAIRQLETALGAGINALIYAGQAGATTRIRLIARRSTLGGRFSDSTWAPRHGRPPSHSP
jgi:hypothetical protein